jgi:hypothetical protein
MPVKALCGKIIFRHNGSHRALVGIFLAKDLFDRYETFTFRGKTLNQGSLADLAAREIASGLSY